MQYYGTLGPACGDVETLEEMFRGGMTGIRLNLSHGDLKENGFLLDLLKEAAGKCGVVPEVLIDLRGPELRIGKMKADTILKKGACVRLTKENVRPNSEEGAAAMGDGGTDDIPVPESVFMVISQYARPDDHILIDDGKLELVLETPQAAAGTEDSTEWANPRAAAEKTLKISSGGLAGSLPARIIRGGTVKSGKSLAVVGKELPMPTLTESDYKNIAQALKYGVTGVMQPFVRNKEDLMILREALQSAGAGEIRIFAKIENMQGVRDLEELLPFADHIVIARGDLGNAMPLWELPRIQKQISAVCRRAGKPFMVVTQMLDSMHERAVPTRAEVADIYNAVLDGASALMLTGETAAGKYPAEAMKYLVNTGREAEKVLVTEGIYKNEKL